MTRGDYPFQARTRCQRPHSRQASPEYWTMSRRAVGHRYGRRHKEVCRRFVRRMARGEVFNCWRGGREINPLGLWDLGHARDNTAVGGERCPSTVREPGDPDDLEAEAGRGRGGAEGVEGVVMTDFSLHDQCSGPVPWVHSSWYAAAKGCRELQSREMSWQRTTDRA